MRYQHKLLISASFLFVTVDTAVAQSLFGPYLEGRQQVQSSGLAGLPADPSPEDLPIVFSDLGESVEQAIAAALTHNPQVDLAEAGIDAARADRFGALGQYLPSIEGSAGYTDESWRSDTLDSLQDRDGLTVGVTVSQPIFTGFSTTNRYKESSSRLEEARLSARQTQEQIALQAARVHANVILSREIVAHRQKNLELVQRQLEITQARMKAGAQSRTGVEQARMRAAQAEVALEQARAELAATEARYRRIVGHAPPVAMTPDLGTDDFGLSDLQMALSQADANNPALAAAEKAAHAAKYARNAARGAFSPSVSLDGSYFQRDVDEGSTLPEDEYQIVARMRVPLFAQGQNVAGLRRANAELASVEAQLMDLRLSVEETVIRTWRAMLAARAQQQAAQTSITAGEQSVKGLKIEYEAGQRSVIDVLDGQRDLVNAQISLSQAEFDLRTSRYELAATIGTLSQLASAPSPAPDTE